MLKDNTVEYLKRIARKPEIIGKEREYLNDAIRYIPYMIEEIDRLRKEVVALQPPAVPSQ